jgi:hypothetical protein
MEESLILWSLFGAGKTDDTNKEQWNADDCQCRTEIAVASEQRLRAIESKEHDRKTEAEPPEDSRALGLMSIHDEPRSSMDTSAG